MTKLSIVFILSLLVLVETCPYYGSGSKETFLISSDSLLKNKKLIEEKDELRLSAFNLLLDNADEMLEGEPFSVTFKKEVPKGATIHDYVSLAPYWWADPSKKDGLPFIQKDGRMNPLRSSYPDAKSLSSLAGQVYVLGLAYFYSGDEKYAKRATYLVNVFFIDKETKMNPNMEFSQLIMGRDSGGNIIDANPLMKVIDGVQLIRESPSWTAKDQMETQKWFGLFLDWMINSEKGKFESRRENNIATFYTTQATMYALFVGREDIAGEIVAARAYENIEKQIAKDGSMPMELRRADPWNYVSYNLGAFHGLMEVSRHVGIDLWEYETEKSGSIRKAFDWVESFAEAEKNSFNFNGHYVQMSTMRRFLDKNPRPDSRSRTALRNTTRARLDLSPGPKANQDNYIEILTK